MAKIPEGYENRTVNGQEFTLFPSHVEVKMPNGMVKSIGLGDFTTILNRTINQEVTLRATLLPANCYIWGQTLTEMQLACYYPGRVRPLIYAGSQSLDTAGKVKPLTFDVPFPNIIITHKLKRKLDSWEHLSAKYFATSKPVAQLTGDFVWDVKQQEQMWPLPFGNVYEDGKLCYGGNTVPKNFKDNFRGLDWHFAILYQSAYNDDLGVRNCTITTRPYEWYKYLNGKKEFPYEVLIGGKKVNTAGQSVAQQVMAEDGNLQLAREGIV